MEIAGSMALKEQTHAHLGNGCVGIMAAAAPAELGVGAVKRTAVRGGWGGFIRPSVTLDIVRQKRELSHNLVLIPHSVRPYAGNLHS